MQHRMLQTKLEEVNSFSSRTNFEIHKPYDRIVKFLFSNFLMAINVSFISLSAQIVFVCIKSKC